ncbi:MAG: hypothetical protein AB7F19_06270 [Candidatus Babeliales bacterium]
MLKKLIAFNFILLAVSIISGNHTLAMENAKVYTFDCKTVLAYYSAVNPNHVIYAQYHKERQIYFAGEETSHDGQPRVITLVGAEELFTLLKNKHTTQQAMNNNTTPK